MRDVTAGVTRYVTRESLDLHHTTPHQLVVTSVCGCLNQVRIRKERKQGRIGFGMEA